MGRNLKPAGRRLSRRCRVVGVLGRSRVRVLTASLVVPALVLLMVPGPGAAQDVNALNERIGEARTDAQDLASEIDAATAKLASAQDRARASGDREAALSALLASGREREAGLARRTTAARDRLTAAREHLARAIEVLSARLVAIYKSGTPDALALLLDADGFDDLVTRSEYLRRVEMADGRLAERVRSLRNAVAEDLAAVRSRRNAAMRLNERLNSARRRIAGVRAAAEASALVAAEARDAQSSTLASLRSNVAKWTRDVERIERISSQEAEGEVISWFGDWAIPQAIVICESGGNYSALNPSSGAGGAYQILPSTWKAYGGRGLPHEASKTEQDRIAALIWQDSGPSAWVCAG